MSDDLYNFYAGMALVGILSHRGTIDKSTALAAHTMAEAMIELQKKLKDEGVSDDK